MWIVFLTGKNTQDHQLDNLRRLYSSFITIHLHVNFRIKTTIIITPAYLRRERCLYHPSRLEYRILCLVYLLWNIILRDFSCFEIFSTVPLVLYPDYLGLTKRKHRKGRFCFAGLHQLGWQKLASFDGKRVRALKRFKGNALYITVTYLLPVKHHVFLCMTNILFELCKILARDSSCTYVYDHIAHIVPARGV